MNQKKQSEFLIRSKAVFTGTAHTPESCTILVEGKRIKRLLPWEYGKQYGKLPLYDYGEQLIMPSFIDAHTHLFSGAVNYSDYVCDELGTCKSETECAKMIAAFAKEHPEYKRIRGAGWFIGNWESGAALPTKKSLDAVISDRPVYLYCSDCHSMWMNSKALEEAGIDKKKEPKGGQVVCLPDGSLSGLLLEPEAMKPAVDRYMEFTKEEQKKVHRQFQQYLAANGIAAVSEMFADDYTTETYGQYDVVKELDWSGELCSHIFAYTKLFGYTEFEQFFQMKEHFSSDHFHINGVKGFIDGVTETHTGMLLEPYEDRPDTCGDGVPLWPADKMEEEILAANQNGIQVRLHAIGDGAVRLALELYEKSEKVNGTPDFYNTIEHIENISPEDIDRFKGHKIIASMQPYHVTLSNNKKVDQIGEVRAKLEWPVKTLLDHGAKIACGTDYPVVDLNPFDTIYAAVTRKNDSGKIICHNPWEALSMEEVLKAYTKGAAEAYHAADWMGTIEEGKLANLIVLSNNLFTIKEEEIRNTHVFVNFFEGERRFLWEKANM